MSAAGSRLIPLFLALACSACVGVISDAGASEEERGARGPEGERGAGCTGLCVGEATLSRLTREEYQNTIRDLLGPAAAGAVRRDQLPPDVAAGPFASNEGLAFDPVWLEGYESIAAAVAAEASSDPSAVMGCNASAGNERGCADAFVASFGRLLFRRPVDTEQRDLYIALWDTLRAGGADVGGALEGVLTAMLISPAFVYRIEVGRETERPGVRALDDWEMASRLSFFLYRSGPDAELLGLAEAGELRTVAQIEAQAERMILDPRFDAAITDFHDAWLGLRGALDVEVDPEAEADFVAVRDEMPDEAARFVVYLFREADPTLEALFTTPLSFPTPELAAYYGLDPALAAVDGSTPVASPEGRAGILTQAAFLASHGDDPNTKAVHRGLAIRTDLLCQHLPPPPPVDAIIAPDPELSSRQQLEEKTASPSCQGCHRLMNPVGFAFEHFDVLGRYRTLDGPHAVDATGDLADTDVDAPFDGAVELGERLAQSREVRACVTEQWMRFALGRNLHEEDQPSVVLAGTRYEDGGRDLRSLVIAITTTDAFRHRRLPE